MAELALTANDPESLLSSWTAPDPELDVVVRWSPGHPHVLVRGELDIATAPLLRAVLEHVHRADGGPVSADLRGVTFLDSAGAAPLVDHDVHVRQASPTVERVLVLLDQAGLSPTSASLL